MGVKDLWSILAPYSERKPLNVLRGKKVAIDLAGWVCEGLNVVDYFIHPRHYLKNLFFRTCHLVWEDVTPLFVLEGMAPELKSIVMAKRNELQFRGVQPKARKDADKDVEKTQKDAVGDKTQKKKGRQRFNQVLKKCESLLNAMGIECIQGPGEAEAYCSFLNRNHIVDGIISQDSDCFAYGAERVYRNFSISTQGAQAAQGGAVDIYDMERIQHSIDFGQNKVIAMALLSGCDYCPAGVDGIGRDSITKLFQKYKNYEILDRLRGWRKETDKYNSLELRVEDRNVCTNCGHIGSTQSHTKHGCGICRSNRSCNEWLWKEERLSIKAELAIRKKALLNADFPNEEIIGEFLGQPEHLPQLNFVWKQPNLVKFIKQIGPLLQWNEIYCFQKFFPILARWQILDDARNGDASTDAYIAPAKIIKKRTVKGVSSMELMWCDRKGFFNGLIPDEQLQSYNVENDTDKVNKLWTTIEPLQLVEAAYPLLLHEFLIKTQKPKRPTARKNKKEKLPLSPLEDMNDLVATTNELAKNLKQNKITQRNKKVNAAKNVQPIEKFFRQKKNVDILPLNINTKTIKSSPMQCSTPIMKSLPIELDSDTEMDSMNTSAIINDIVGRQTQREVQVYTGRILQYENLTGKMYEEASAYGSKDDLDLFRATKRNFSMTSNDSRTSTSKKFSHDDSFDVMVKVGDKHFSANNYGEAIDSPIHRFKRQHLLY